MFRRVLQRLRPLICPFRPLVWRIPRGASVLDIGCGTGAFLLHLAARSHIRDGLGVDVSRSALAVAREAWLRKRAASPECSLDFQEVSSLGSLSGRTWGVVSMVDVLHHISPAQQEEFTRAAMRRVSASGILLYKDMCDKPWWKAGMNRLHDALVARERIHYVPLDDVIRWAGEEGLQVEAKEYYSRFWYGHELLVLRRRGKGA